MRSHASLGQLRLIGRISLWFAGAALAALIALVGLAEPASSDYFETISQLSAARQKLPMLMAVGGLLLAIGTALTTWLIALYSSFRVAGPLHRFCIDLEQGIRTGEVPHIRIRRADDLHDEARHLEESVAALYTHYNELDQALDEAMRCLRHDGIDAGEDALARVRRIAARARV